MALDLRHAETGCRCRDRDDFPEIPLLRLLWRIRHAPDGKPAPEQVEHQEPGGIGRSGFEEVAFLPSDGRRTLGEVLLGDPVVELPADRFGVTGQVQRGGRDRLRAVAHGCTPLRGKSSARGATLSPGAISGSRGNASPLRTGTYPAAPSRAAH